LHILLIKYCTPFSVLLFSVFSFADSTYSGNLFFVINLYGADDEGKILSEFTGIKPSSGFYAFLETFVFSFSKVKSNYSTYSNQKEGLWRTRDPY
jgi:hypothetical protein